MIVRHFGVGLAAILFFSASGMAAVADSAPGACMIRFETQRRDPQTDKVITTHEEVYPRSVNYQRARQEPNSHLSVILHQMSSFRGGFARMLKV